MLPAAYTNVDQYFVEACSFLAQHAGVYDFPLTHFFSNKVWQSVPSEWMQALGKAPVQELSQVPYGYIREEWPQSLKAFIRVAIDLAVPRDITGVDPVAIGRSLSKGMTPKKEHEVSHVTAVVTSLCEHHNCHHVVDVGSGLGYLSLVLSQQQALHVLGVECEETRSHAAQLRATKTETLHNFEAVTLSLCDTPESRSAFAQLIQRTCKPENSGHCGNNFHQSKTSESGQGELHQKQSRELPKTRNENLPADNMTGTCMSDNESCHPGAVTLDSLPLDLSKSSRVPRYHTGACFNPSSNDATEYVTSPNSVGPIRMPPSVSGRDGDHSAILRTADLQRVESDVSLMSSKDSLPESVLSTYSDQAQLLLTLEEKPRPSSSSQETHSEHKCGCAQENAEYVCHSRKLSPQDVVDCRCKPQTTSSDAISKGSPLECLKSEMCEQGSASRTWSKSCEHGFECRAAKQCCKQFCEIDSTSTAPREATSTQTFARDSGLDPVGSGHGGPVDAGCGCAETRQCCQVAAAGVCMVGLHCCGDLTPAMLKLFVQETRLQCLVCLSCCYHRMSSKEGRYQQFPLSKTLQTIYAKTSSEQGGWTLDQFALRLAAQETRVRWKAQTAEDHEHHVKNVAYRALLQLAGQHVGVEVNKLKRKLARRTDFIDVHTYLSAIRDRINVSDNKFAELAAKFHILHDEHLPRLQLIEPFTCLQVLLQPVVESLILLDRVTYLQELGIKARLQPVMDEALSPRNLAIVAEKYHNCHHCREPSS